jgi:hypothetical protein
MSCNTTQPNSCQSQQQAGGDLGRAWGVPLKQRAPRRAFSSMLFDTGAAHARAAFFSRVLRIAEQQDSRGLRKQRLSSGAAGTHGPERAPTWRHLFDRGRPAAAAPAAAGGSMCARVAFM